MRTHVQAPHPTSSLKPASEAPSRAREGFAPSPPFALEKAGTAQPFSTPSSADLRLPPVHPPGAIPEKPGLPENLRAGVERLSRLPLGDVQVHYNSPEPGRHRALAFTKGRDIHLGPGQEKHLPHEAWHVVQQRQGRVTPTLRAGSHRINDDPALEKEAEEMGSQALRLHAKEPPAAGPAPRTGSPAPPGAVIQMRYDIRATEEQLETLREWKPLNRWHDLQWPPLLRKAYAYIGQLEAALDDDEDLALLWVEERKVDELAQELDELTQRFDDAEEPGEERDSRSAARRRRDRSRSPIRNKNRARSRSRSRSRSRDRSPLRGRGGRNRHDLAEQIDRTNRELFQQLQAIKRMFPLSDGGFSAKGRAHAMGESEDVIMGFSEVKTWFGDVTLGNASLSDTKSVYKEPHGLRVDENSGDPYLPADVRDVPDHQKLAALESKIAALDPAQKFEGNRAPAPYPRGAGQAANMGGANASAYAALSGVADWRHYRWEWLHVRAASLGGKTDGSNLVVGTRDTNTQMMPFEANIRHLGTIVHDNPMRYKKLEAKFTAEGQADPAKHKVDAIKLTWKLVKADAAPDTVKDVKGEAKFSPLRTNASISKTEVGILETALKEEREKATTD